MFDREEIERRFDYNPPKDDEARLDHEFVRHTLKTTAEHLIDTIPESRELSLAITKLEEAMFWANAAIARRIQ